MVHEHKPATKKLALIIICLLPTCFCAVAYGYYKLPRLLPPTQYGNILINRTSAKNGVKAAIFSHWIHRRKHTCRVCHGELEFSMKVNTTIITEQANKSGRFCGASGCHDGKVSFGHEDKASCEKCHNGLIDYGTEKFDKLANAPFAPFGNRIDWVESLHTGVIAPLNHLKNRPKEITLNKTLSLEAEWNFVPTSVFSHKIHTEWLDCNNCHPEIFSIKKKGTEDFSMANILKGEFCGVCHLTVAFPINDCKRCHPGMKNGI